VDIEEPPGILGGVREDSEAWIEAVNRAWDDADSESICAVAELDEHEILPEEE